MQRDEVLAALREIIPEDVTDREKTVVLEVVGQVLDIREFLQRIEQNTEALAVRAETMLPDHHRADPEIVEVLETDKVEIVNQLLSPNPHRKWILCSSATDPHGVTHYSLGRRL